MKFFVPITTIALLASSVVALPQINRPEVRSLSEQSSSLLNRRSFYGGSSNMLSRRAYEDRSTLGRAVEAHTQAATANQQAAYAQTAVSQVYRDHAHAHATAGNAEHAAEYHDIADYHKKQALHFQNAADHHNRIIRMGTTGPLKSNHQHHIHTAAHSESSAIAGKEEADQAMQSLAGHHAHGHSGR